MNVRAAHINRARLVLLALILLFFLPMVFAWIMYASKSKLNTVNQGDLISSPFSISQLAINNITPKKRLWRLVYFNVGVCDQSCQQGLLHLRQIRLALGAERDRVERVLLTYSPADTHLKSWLAEKYPGTQYWMVQKPLFNKIINENVKQSYALTTGTIYVVDPLGNVMMSYHPNMDPIGVLNDMERLLKVSEIG